VLHDIGMGWPAPCADVEGASCHHRRHRRGAEPARGGPPVRRLPGRVRCLVTPDPFKRPKWSYLRFQADMPNACWQSDFTHTLWPQAPGPRS
jgi:hypothetical protein